MLKEILEELFSRESLSNIFSSNNTYISGHSKSRPICTNRQGIGFEHELRLIEVWASSLERYDLHNSSFMGP